ncbi:DUF5996 family protein [Catellatospora tritici]|uniref:DUF5996 family protein n=1 Tax=Catellatospora tritici TaxID=2851566 RepID=UPI001C2D5471|nr:DUF5996 family protein [Catellatospora tritici]MBV1852821.1 hypothetical protein [Catellatospora tritici]
MTSRGAWPALPLDRWSDTRDTLQLWTQIVGKVRLALEPMVNHWWQVPLYVDARGLTTSLMPYGVIGLEMVFDFRRHVLELRTTDGRVAEVDLRGRSVADLYADVLARLDDLDIQVDLMGRPVELPEVVPFAADRQHCAYDPDFAHAFWLSLVQTHRVLTEFRSRFVGKVSPVHFFWGAFDLAVTRFSGRPAPLHPGGVPNCPDRVSQEAYSHEVSSCGYWPGGGGQGIFYAYAYPEPPGFRDRVPAGAHYDEQLGEFVLPYETVARADDPDAVLLAFLQHTYDSAADLAAWDRPNLERV